MSVFDFENTSGINFTSSGARLGFDLIASRDWTGPFYDWAIDQDGDLEAIRLSADLSDAFSVYLINWRQQGAGFRFPEMTIAISFDYESRATPYASIFYTGDLYINSDGSGLSGIITDFQEQRDGANEVYLATGGSWDAEQLAVLNPRDGFNYIVKDSDEFYGSGFADTIEGGSGDDLIDGKGGNDQLIGGPGNDSLIGAEGIDGFLDGFGVNYFQGGSSGDSFFLNKGKSGYWTDSPQREDNVFWYETRKVKIKKKNGKKKRIRKTFAYVDNDFDVILDFSPAEDQIFTKADPFTWDVNVNGFNGVVLADGDNVFGLISDMTESQFLSITLNAW